jgi:hypothetical protein
MLCQQFQCFIHRYPKMLGDLFDLIASGRGTELLGRFHIWTIAQPGFHLVAETGLLKLQVTKVGFSQQGGNNAGAWAATAELNASFSEPPN